jgi:hypothetical protein
MCAGRVAGPFSALRSRAGTKAWIDRITYLLRGSAAATASFRVRNAPHTPPGAT